MAVAERAPFAGRWSPLINENFATMADVHRILGQLPDGVDQMATADGRAKTSEASRARLARMVGCDVVTPAAARACWRTVANGKSHHHDGDAGPSSALPADAPISRRHRR
jgi:hypothetical protein